MPLAEALASGLFGVLLPLAFALTMLFALPSARISSSPLRAHSHVFRLPQGSVRLRESDSSRWTWRNETVVGHFIVHQGLEERAIAGASKPASGCCGTLGGRLYAAEAYELQAANDGTFAAADVSSSFASAVSAWEAVIGNKFGSQTAVTETAGLVFNGKNQVGLGVLEVDSPGALAVTGLWFVCPGGGSVDGCAQTLEVSEWDQTYDLRDYDWSLDGSSSNYNLYPVFLHELGHSAGLDDLYSSGCSGATMYGYRSRGDLSRDSIDSATKACARNLYGISGSGSGSGSGGTAWREIVVLTLACLAF